jgi:hypothetical protein
MSIHPSSPMEPTDAAELVRSLAREVDARVDGRSAELAHFGAWVRTRLDVLAERLTSAHRSRHTGAKASRRKRLELN